RRGWRRGSAQAWPLPTPRVLPPPSPRCKTAVSRSFRLLPASRPGDLLRPPPPDTLLQHPPARLREPLGAARDGGLLFDGPSAAHPHLTSESRVVQHPPDPLRHLFRLLEVHGEARHPVLDEVDDGARPRRRHDG